MARWMIRWSAHTAGEFDFEGPAEPMGGHLPAHLLETATGEAVAEAVAAAAGGEMDVQIEAVVRLE